MATPTSSRNRYKRRASRRPTSSATRASRSKASTNSSRITRSGGQGGSRARITRASERVKTGRARVTGGARPALPPGRKGGPMVKAGSSEMMSPRRKAALDRLRGGGSSSSGATRVGKPGAGGPKPQPRLTGKPTVGSRIRSSGYASDLRKLKSLAKQGGAIGKRAAAALLKLGIKYSPAAGTFAKVAGATAAKAAPGVLLAGVLAASAGRPGSAKVSRLGISKDGNAPVRRTPLNKVGRSQATSRKVGPKAVEGGYTISKKGREQAAAQRKAKTTAPTKTTAPSRPTNTVPPAPKRDRMEKATHDERMAKWAMSNRKMIEKSGTKKQREILAKALKKK